MIVNEEYDGIGAEHTPEIHLIDGTLLSDCFILDMLVGGILIQHIEENVEKHYQFIPYWRITSIIQEQIT